MTFGELWSQYRIAAVESVGLLEAAERATYGEDRAAEAAAWAAYGQARRDLRDIRARIKEAGDPA